MSRFAKLVLSGFTALSLSFTPMPAVSGPDGEDIAKVIAGVAVLGIVAAAANDRKKKRRARTTGAIPLSRNGSIDRPRVIEGEIRRPGARAPRYNAVRRIALPDRCIRIVSTRRGDRTVYAARCLQRNYSYANHLPHFCKLQIRTNNRVRHAYGARCLRRDGWQVARF